MAYEIPTEPTLGQVMKRINLVRKDLAKKLANTPQQEWGAEPVREMCNHEKELHTALMVLRDLAGDQGAFAGGAMKEPVAVPQASAALTLSADPLPAMPPQSIAYWLGIDVGGDAPAYCVMVAYRSESDARSAMAMLSAAPALEAPAAPLLQALQVSRQPDCPEGHVLRDWTQGWNECAAYVERVALEAAHQAPAAPSADERAAYVEFLAGKFPRTYSKEDAEHWWDNDHVSALTWQAARAVAAAPVAPAVDAALPTWWPNFIQCVAELPDRNSPEGEPDAMIATADELGACALAAQAEAKGE